MRRLPGAIFFKDIAMRNVQIILTSLLFLLLSCCPLLACELSVAHRYLSLRSR